MCPLGGYCSGVDVTWRTVKPKYGWWRLQDTTVGNTSHPPDCLNTKENQKRSQPTCVFEKCLYPHACHGSPNPGTYTLVSEDLEVYDPADQDSNLTETCDETKG